MKTEFKSKFLQHMIAKKSNDKGFTLIELLVVIIIIGILSAIALPSFLNQASKAKQSEAKNTVGAVNSAQKAHYMENSAFADSMDALATGLPTSTNNYSYTISAETGSALATIVTSDAADPATKRYAGATEQYPNASSDSVIASIVCETDDPGATITAPTGAEPTDSCPDNSSKL